MIIPIRTEMVARRTPTTNYALIFVNCVAFGLFQLFQADSIQSFRDHYLVFDGGWPSLHQFFTYQFLHADLMHLGGNMLFLWVFGNSVNAKMGDLGYLFFYLASGVFAATMFAVGSHSSLVGASGAIAGVTTAYLALFPRSRVTVLIVFFLITTIEVPALLLIGVKVVLWDNIIAPGAGAAGNVAYSAHLAGYLFGFLGASMMLAVRAIPRDHFDMLGLIDRWNRRRAFRSTMADPNARRQATFGTVARHVAPTSQQQKLDAERYDRVTDLRYQISELLESGDMQGAAAMYEKLVEIDPGQCLPAQQQVLVARAFFALNKIPQAANAFTIYLAHYRDGYEANDIRLLLGILYARDLQQYNKADELLTETLSKVQDSQRRDQCRQWLDFVRKQLGKPTPDA
jgi:membrane associated rhomboid family serine protease